MCGHGRVEDSLVTSQIIKRARPNAVDSRAQVLMVKFSDRERKRTAQASVSFLALQQDVDHRQRWGRSEVKRGSEHCSDLSFRVPRRQSPTSSVVSVRPVADFYDCSLAMVRNAGTW
eukprot:6179540-Pleurochrysis_carterae.AAC.3